MYKILRFLFSRRFLIALIALLQIVWVYVFLSDIIVLGPYIYIGFTLFSVVIMAYIAERDNLNPSYKMLWLIFMVIFPVTGALLYFFWGNRKLAKRHQDTLEIIQSDTEKLFFQDDNLLKKIKDKDTNLEKQAKYLSNIAKGMLYENTAVKYYKMGEDFFIDYLEDLKNAKKSIFMQYFIIDEGYMWDEILKILKEKAAEGVDVRVLYDGFGSLLTLPDDYEKTLQKMGIKAEVFSPIKLSYRIGDYLILNHRDHRKLTVIDGNIGYSGGLNIADEYINKINKFGRWKDTAVRLYGEGTFGLTNIFLQSWQFVTKEVEMYDKYKPSVKGKADGIIQPYHDTPLDTYNVCENAYLNVINGATDYVYIATPYLIIDNEMVTSLTLAAQSGADVRIVVPGVPDKWYAFYITQSYYKTLLEGGVRIYEYTPGFLHAKMYVCDDKQAIVGSANMDYRSLYLHYENCVSFYGGSVVKDVKADFNEMFLDSKEVSLLDVKNTPLLKRLYQIFFKILSPLM